MILGVNRDRLNTVNVVLYACVRTLAMHCAASKGHVGCLATLLQQQEVDVDAADKNGCAALSYAASYGHCAATWRLLQSKADSDHRDNRGRT